MRSTKVVTIKKKNPVLDHGTPLISHYNQQFFKSLFIDFLNVIFVNDIKVKLKKK